MPRLQVCRSVGALPSAPAEFKFNLAALILATSSCNVLFNNCRQNAENGMPECLCI